MTTAPPVEVLPPTYDELVSVDRLVHGEHNPRQVRPTEELRRSIERDGLQQPLIVRPDEHHDVYHVTDGWQRYQAATGLGWEHLPVRIYETPLEALAATESASIVREWSTYEWAQYCQSLASELEASSRRQLAERVADRTVRCPQTVWQYLSALSLPEVVHPLFVDGPEGSEQAWATLKHYNADVRRYRGLSWRVAARLGARAHDGGLERSRVLAIAADAVEYGVEDGLSFVEAAAEQPDTPLRTIHRYVQQERAHEAYLQVPSVAIAVSDAQKEAVMAYCAEQRVSLSALVEEQMRAFAREVSE